jgi:hypothetical protein
MKRTIKILSSLATVLVVLGFSTLAFAQGADAATASPATPAPLVRSVAR